MDELPLSPSKSSFNKNFTLPRYAPSFEHPVDEELKEGSPTKESHTQRRYPKSTAKKRRLKRKPLDHTSSSADKIPDFLAFHYYIYPKRELDQLLFKQKSATKRRTLSIEKV